MQALCRMKGAVHTGPIPQVNTIERTELLMSISNDRSQDIIAESESMQAVLRQVAQVAPTKVPVLITGETGVGKDVIAQAIHANSLRKNRPFKTVNCGAFYQDLLHSELFGHEPGAFTGATSQRRGVFEQADGGTLFLDEIGEMSHEVQVTFLRILETQVFTRLGGETDIKVDVRIVAATNADLETKMLNGEFRQDLYERLSVFPIAIPPLRERREDIPALVKLFISEFNRTHGKPIRVTPKILSQLKDGGWPGNVRQLKNAIERAVIVAQTDELKSEDFLDAPGDPKRITYRGITRGGRKTETEYKSGLPSETALGVEAFKANMDTAEKLWNFIWTSKSTLDEISTYIFHMIYKRHLDGNQGNERKATEATRATLGGISSHLFNRHKNNRPKNIENTA